MKKIGLYIVLYFLQFAAVGQTQEAETYYVKAFSEMSDMLTGHDTLSIKRAVFLSEWAYYEGELDYKKDFCDEINRIVAFISLFYETNKLNLYKTGKQIALNEYFFKPYSGNQYKPYTYDYDTFFGENATWECQFVSKVLKTHTGQCRSLPWMYKILANEIHADVFIAQAPRHCYIMYKDEDNLTPEEWINLELTTQQMQPAWWIKKDFEISDTAVEVGTYMTPLTDVQTVASQMADLAFGYKEKFNRYDEFTYECVSRSLEFYPMNPNACIIQCKSLEQMIQDQLRINGYLIDDYVSRLLCLLEDAKQRFDNTHMTEETEEIRERRIQQAIDAQYLTKNND